MTGIGKIRKVEESVRLKSGQGVCWMLYLDCGHLVFKVRLPSSLPPQEVECEFCTRGAKRLKG